MTSKTSLGVVVGFEYYGRFLAQLVNEHSDHWHLEYYSASHLDTLRSAVALMSARVIISFGGPSPNALLVEIARRRKVPVVVIWAGTDVLAAQKEPQLLEVIKRYGFTNLSDGPWLVKELSEIGIASTYLPVTAVAPPSALAPLPNQFRVLTYLPEPRRAFYGEKLVYAIARQLPGVPFTVVGRGIRNPVAPPNVEFVGDVDDMARYIDDSVVLLRMPQHDGKSMLVLEAMARGRHVVWTYDFPGVTYAQRQTDALAILRQMHELHKRGELGLNTCGYDFVSRTFGRAQLAAGFTAELDRAQPRHQETSARNRVAISGLSLFVAQVTKVLQEQEIGWVPRTLRMSCRLEVLTSMWSLLDADVWYSIGSPIGDRWLHLFARILRKPRVVHWVGTDIMELRQNRHLQRLCTRPGVENLAEVDWTIAELRLLGISARLAPLPIAKTDERFLPPLPEQFTVLLYLPRTRGEFYGRREYERLIRTFSGEGVRFIVVGGGELYAPPDSDVEHLGWRTSLKDVYTRSTVLVRFTRHDGLSLMALEALTHGRHVLWSQDFPFIQQVQSYNDIEREIRDLLGRHRRGELDLQRDGARYIAETYEGGRCLKRIAEAWSSAALSRQRKALAVEST